MVMFTCNAQQVLRGAVICLWGVSLAALQGQDELLNGHCTSHVQPTLHASDTLISLINKQHKADSRHLRCCLAVKRNGLYIEGLHT